MNSETTNPEGCDSYGPCRHLTCARCGQHTDNNTQGHYWGFCHVTGDTRDFHFCCPGDCELHGSGDNPAGEA